ncbi:MAG: glycosyltransferase [Ferruginibacter sp.]|nr:glycosyltransferase [Ferruginibacter sp.]
MHNSEPLFTIATITYNSSKWIRQAIESILASSYTNFELVISDDCSTDNTWDIVSEYKDVRIRSWRNENNIGEYPNRNKVLNSAKGQYILFVDGDDILYKNSLSTYASLINYFPEVPAIWGVYPVYFDFVVFPYLFTALELSSLNFLSTYPITVVGFAESLFKVSSLKEMGGLDERFASGDTFLKRKFSCIYDVLLIPAGAVFWRQHDGQASNKVRTAYKNLMETYLIDKEILSSNYHPFSSDTLLKARSNLKIRTIKLIFKNTIQKLKIFDFFQLLKRLHIPLSDIKYLFKRGNYTYKIKSPELLPLKNDYNFVETNTKC